MINFNVNFDNSHGYYYFNRKQNTDFLGQFSAEKCNREIVTTWRYDAEGNIVYYKYDKQTGEVIEKNVYKNPYKDLVQQKNKLV